MNKVYPIGYNLHGSHQRVCELMQDSKMLIVDCRINPWSPNPVWQKINLLKEWKARYRVAGGYLGNLMHAHNRREVGEAPGKIHIQIAAPEKGIKGLMMYLNEGYDLIILCACAAYENCHLKTIVEMLKARMPEVEIIRSGRPIVQPNTIKCLSISQPYASWIVHPEWLARYDIPAKKLENRSWETSYRGPLLIHAAKSYETGAISSRSLKFPGLELIPRNFPAGAIIGIADLIDIKDFVDDPWYAGQFAWMLDNIRAIEPIEYRGQRGLFDVPYNVLHGLPQEPKVPLILDSGPLDREEPSHA
jgi:hypothetical protein